MSKKTFAVFLIVLLLILVSSVATAVAQDPIFEPGNLAPHCVVVDHPYSSYAVLCKDDNIVGVKIKEVGLRCNLKWDAKSMSLVVTDNLNIDSRRAGPRKAHLTWWVFDADGNVVQGHFTR